MSKHSFLVVVDGTDEMEVSLKYACIKAKKTNGHLILASFIKPIDVLTTKSVGDIMKNEARQEAETMLHKASGYVKEETGITPTLHVKEGEQIEELIKLIQEEKNISELILAASMDEKGPGPIISSTITARNYSRLNIPIIIVPGNSLKENINKVG